MNTHQLHHELTKRYNKVDASLHCQTNLENALPKDNEELTPYVQYERKAELFNIINNCKETLTFQQACELGDVVLTMLKKNYGRNLAALKKANEELIGERRS
tara:strand:- start:323 stop:628 length:306 start_codon:yes stop_codon:yes gene_type:complete